RSCRATSAAAPATRASSTGWRRQWPPSPDRAADPPPAEGELRMRESLLGRYIGASVTRREDKRLLAGAGRYIDDVTVPGMLHAAFLRSPYPHAEIRSVDLEAARALPGVHLILTGADLESRTYPFFGTLALP